MKQQLKLVDNQTELVAKVKTLEYEIKDTNTQLVSARDTLEEVLADYNLKSDTNKPVGIRPRLEDPTWVWALHRDPPVPCIGALRAPAIGPALT